MLPSGRQPIFYNRVHWAKTYLAQAKLLEITRRAHFRITDRGQEVLRKNSDRVDVRLLEKFPEFNEFKERARASQTGAGLSPSMWEVTTAEAQTKLATPDEILRSTIADFDAALSSELLGSHSVIAPCLLRKPDCHTTAAYGLRWITRGGGEGNR
jgi:restriction system protein